MKENDLLCYLKSKVITKFKQKMREIKLCEFIHFRILRGDNTLELGKTMNFDDFS